MKEGTAEKKLIYIENKQTDPRYNLAFEEFVFQNLPEIVSGESDVAVPVLLLWQN